MNYLKILHTCPYCNGVLLIQHTDNQIIYECDDCKIDYQYEEIEPKNDYFVTVK